MTTTATKPRDLALDTTDRHPLERPAQELILYRLRCAQTANGLSHYYMWGDVAPEKVLL